MLRLTRTQRDRIGSSRLGGFDDKVAALLINTYGETHDIDLVSFGAHVSKARAYAQALGFRAERHLFDVIEALLLNGDVLKRNAAFHAIIDRPLWSDEEKCRRIRTQFVTSHPAYKNPVEMS